MPNDDYPFDYGSAPADSHLPASPGSTSPQPRRSLVAVHPRSVGLRAFFA